MAKQYMKVYYELLENGFNPNETLVYSYIIGFGDKPCKTVNKTIAKKMNMSVPTVQRIITRLKKDGLIIETYVKGRREIMFNKDGYTHYRSKWLIDNAKKQARLERAESNKNDVETKKTDVETKNKVNEPSLKEKSDEIKAMIDEEIEQSSKS